MFRAFIIALVAKSAAEQVQSLGRLLMIRAIKLEVGIKGGPQIMFRQVEARLDRVSDSDGAQHLGFYCGLVVQLCFRARTSLIQHIGQRGIMAFLGVGRTRSGIGEAQHVPKEGVDAIRLGLFQLRPVSLRARDAGLLECGGDAGGE